MKLTTLLFYIYIAAACSPIVGAHIAKGSSEARKIMKSFTAVSLSLAGSGVALWVVAMLVI